MNKTKRKSPFFDAAVTAVSSVDDAPVNVSRFGHADIVDGLHLLLYTEPPPAGSRESIRMLNGDGSESARFPVVRFVSEPQWDPSDRPLRIGFVSGRHPELDRVVDLYLLRNSEIRQFDTGADLEQEVYERARRLFDEAVAAKQRCLEALHTGLETVTVGFYRAVVEHARSVGPHVGSKTHLRPRIWSAPRVDVNRLIAQAKGALDARSLRKALNRIVEEVPTFVRIEQVSSGNRETIMLHWIPERPMLASERDWFVRRARVAKPILDALHQRAQYRDSSVWKLA